METRSISLRPARAVSRGWRPLATATALTAALVPAALAQASPAAADTPADRAYRLPWFPFHSHH